MLTSTLVVVRSRAPGTLAPGLAAGAVSTLILAACGRRTPGGAWAPINAVSHWVWGAPALRRDEASVRDTLLGTAIHVGCSLLWARVYDSVRCRRRRPTVANAVSDAVAVTTVAAAVDFTLTSERFRPGFEHRLSPHSLTCVYASVALTLAAYGAKALR